MHCCRRFLRVFYLRQNVSWTNKSWLNCPRIYFVKFNLRLTSRKYEKTKNCEYLLNIKSFRWCSPRFTRYTTDTRGSYMHYLKIHTCKKWSQYTMLLALLSAADFNITLKFNNSNSLNISKELKSSHSSPRFYLTDYPYSYRTF